MYVNNTTKAPIKDVSFEGYWFTLPVGVSLVWDKFGEFLIGVIYKMEGSGGGMPPVLPATAEQWDGKKYAQVRRFEINSELIPKKDDLFKIAKQRGVAADVIEAWKEDESIDNKEIAQAINELAVPDSVLYPEASGAPAAAPAAPKPVASADDIVADATGDVAPQAPAAVATRKPAAKKPAAKKPAAKTPTTPRRPAPKAE